MTQGAAADDAPVQRAVRVPDVRHSRTRFRSRGCSRSTTRSARARRATASATSSSSTWIWSCPIDAKSINDGAIEPWTKPHYRAASRNSSASRTEASVRLDVPWRDLSDDERRFVVEGDGEFDGIAGFFRRLERKKYKVHVRVFLSRYRGYQTCPDCGGTRLRREARDVRVGGQTIDAVCALTVKEAARVLRRRWRSARRTRWWPTRSCARSAGGSAF